MRIRANTTEAKAVKAAIAVTGRRWCSSHNGEADASNGSMIKANRQMRFCCFPCQEKRKVKR